MIQNIPKRKIKDSVFTNMFRDKKYLLELYKALHPEDINVSEDEIKDVTLKHVLIDADYNDLGFSVRDRLMILVESQSTWTYNIIIRAMMYLIQTYHDYFKRTNQNLYGSKKVNMPKPELYMIYTGDRKEIPDTISLSEDFFNGEKIAIDAKVKVLYRENEKDIIGQYIIFSKVYNEQRKQYGETKKAITETIRICKDRNVLKEYLENREQEVVDIMMTLFDDEQILKAYAYDIARNVEAETARRVEAETARRVEAETARRVEAETARRVEAETLRKSEEKTAIQMIKKGKLSLEEIAEYVPSISMEELKRLEAEVMQLA